MMMRLPSRWPRQATTMALVLLLAAAPAAAATQISGQILGPAGITPVPGARVAFAHLTTGNVVRSEPSDADGAFSIEGLAPGRYDVAIETDRGLWLADREVSIEADSQSRLAFALREGQGDPAGGEPRPGVVGIAVLLDEDSRSTAAPPGRKKKILIATGTGLGVLALALLAGSSSGQEASPFTP